VLKIVIISWRDTRADSIWTHEEEIHNTHSEDCETVGFLIHDTEQDYKVTPTHGEDGNTMGFVVIPKSKTVKAYEIQNETLSPLPPLVLIHDPNDPANAMM